MLLMLASFTLRHRGIGTGISEASKRFPIFPFATQGGKHLFSTKKLCPTERLRSGFRLT